ncbi:MAG: UDP-2-acetamido-3-amino-2,3-dideoxy-D-glucuronate N-acetyltransferase [Chlamydiae bacterium]|nr:UDP-2-acetamido-3-amino-2,3-dideoxy-D-glucuronate N-acetyltransferase [Chlamydiota bacterium]
MSKEGSLKNIAIVGAGRWGKNLTRNFYNLGVLHTICDTNESLLDTYQEQYPEVHLTTNFKTVLENPLITRIVIAAPAAIHYVLTKQALLAGKDVYVEKPLCLDSNEGEELIKLAEKGEQILMIGHLLQYHPYVRRLQELVGSGELGKLQYIVSNRLNLGAIRTEENALWNFAPHDVSVILSLCGHRMPLQVRCMGAAYVSQGVADTTLTALRFDGDVRAHIYVSWLNPFKEQKLVVVGCSGMAVFDDTKPWEEKLVLYRHHLKWDQGRIPLINEGDAEKVIVPQEEPLRAECEHFIKCCDERITPRTDGQEGLRVLKVLQAAQASLNVDGDGKDPSEKHYLTQGTAANYFVHPTAVIDSNVDIGEDTKIWHFSHIMEKAKIGPSCNIGQNAVVSPGVVLGRNVKVQNNVSIYSGVVCEDDVFLGPSMVFTNINNPRSAVSRRGQYKNTFVRKGATIGANATILTGIELGEHCFIGAGAIVTKDVKPFALVVGNPGRQVGWMSRYGERINLPLETPEGETLTAACPSTGEIYKLEKNTLTIFEKTIEGKYDKEVAAHKLS